MGFSLFGPSLFLKKYFMDLTHKEIILKAVGNFEWPDLVLSDGNQGETPLRQCADLLSLVKVLESVRVISSFAPLEGSSGFLVKHGTCKCKRKAGVMSDETAEQEQPRGVLVTVIQGQFLQDFRENKAHWKEQQTAGTDNVRSTIHFQKWTVEVLCTLMCPKAKKGS